MIKIKLMNKILLLLPLFLFNLFTYAQTGPLTDICLVTVDTPITIFITDLMGRKVKHFSPIKVLGQHQIKIDMEPYKAGIYSIVLTQSNRVYSQALFKL